MWIHAKRNKCRSSRIQLAETPVLAKDRNEGQTIWQEKNGLTRKRMNPGLLFSLSQVHITFLFTQELLHNMRENKHCAFGRQHHFYFMIVPQQLFPDWGKLSRLHDNRWGEAHTILHLNTCVCQNTSFIHKKFFRCCKVRGTQWVC